MAVEAWLVLGWRDRFYGAFYQQSHHLRAQDMCALALNKGGDHTAEAQGLVVSNLILLSP